MERILAGAGGRSGCGHHHARQYVHPYDQGLCGARKSARACAHAREAGTPDPRALPGARLPARRLGARCGSRHATHSQHALRCDVTRGPSALRAPQAPLRRAQGRREKEAESCLDQTRWAVASRPGPRARLGALRARRRAEGLVCAVMKVWCVCVWSGVERRAAREKVGANNVATPPLRSL